jgi:spoIIIJ-associated protein
VVKSKTEVVKKQSGAIKKTLAKKPVQKKKAKEAQKIIKESSTKLLKLMGLEKAKINLSQKEETIKIDIDYPDPGILIGNQGETISALQLILSLMVYKKTGQWQRLLVNVADYLEKRTESLEKMALNAAQRVKFSSRETVMPYLNSAERRIIHLILADNADVITESAGEGRERRLIVKPKK